MRTLYNILFGLGFLVSSPFYFLKLWRRGNWREGFSQRFGVYENKLKQALANRHILWMHAVSVGEMNVCMQIIRALESRAPNLKIVVSTTTTTGMGELQKRFPGPKISKIYYPIDRRKYVSRALSIIHPNLVVLVESEIWPNFIWRARARGTPVMLVNARLSDRSYPRFKRLGFFFREIFGQLASVGAQNDPDAAKLRELGCVPERIHVVGNLKFDSAADTVQNPEAIAALLAQAGVSPGDPVLVAGSTHDGEEKLLGRIFMRLREKFPSLFLILVPRHFERARDAGRQLSDIGLKFVYRTDITPEWKRTPGTGRCLLVNTTGELRGFYAHATLVFVGKSLTAKGGQNPLEPAILGKPVLFGPNMQNFADVVRILVGQNGAVQVPDAAGLEKAVADLLADAPRREELGANARRVVIENQGGVARTVDLIVGQLEKMGIYTVEA